MRPTAYIGCHHSAIGVPTGRVSISATVEPSPSTSSADRGADARRTPVAATTASSIPTPKSAALASGENHTDQLSAAAPDSSVAQTRYAAPTTTSATGRTEATATRPARVPVRCTRRLSNGTESATRT